MEKRFQIIENNKTVTGYSNFRLPFEPKNISLSYREQLKRNIRTLQLDNNEILRARYTTNVVGFFDIENILFYNVGASSFKNICRNGIIMEFENKMNLTYPDLNHKVEYQIINKRQKLFAKFEKRISNFDFQIPALNTENSVCDYWYAMHSGSIVLNQLNQDSINDFGVYIELETNQMKFNIVAIMKSLVDGVISAYHSESNIDDAAVERISKKLKIDKMRIIEYLKTDEYSILSKRNLVSAYRNGVKWNPADDKCKELTIYPRINNTIKNVRIKGFLYELS
jgi:hypothetical protein